jgi:hypothetical protein
MENTTSYTEGQELWARLDEGSLAKVTFVRTLDDVVEVQLGEKEKIVLDPPQLATDRQALLDTEPKLQGAELEEVILAAANEVATQISTMLQRAEVYANDRWGEGTERTGAFMSAAYGASLGVAQGWMADAPAGAQGICDTTARTIAIHIMKQRELDTTELEKVNEQ